MVRLTGGEWRGRTLAVPPGIRPTTELARKAVFDILGQDVPGTRVLDAAAGSGAFGLEALSRGAASALFVERDRGVAKVLAENVARVGAGERASIRVEPVGLFVRRASERYDLVFHDPPWADESAEDLEALLLLLAPGGTLVHERGDGRSPLAAAGGPEPVDVRRYGTTWLHFFRG